MGGDLLLDKKIEIFIAGAQKAGTTSILKYLEMLPDVVTHPQSEMTYFYNDDEYVSGIQYLRSHYGLTPFANSILVAKHAAMSRSEVALERLKEYNKDCRIIFCIRDPVERAFSSYLMEKRKGSLTGSFSEVIDYAFENRDHWYFNVLIQLGCYQHHIQRILKFFPDTQLYKVDLDHLKKNYAVEIKKLLKWLNLDSGILPEGKAFNTKHEVSISKAQQFGARNPQLKKVLINLFGYSRIVRLTQMIFKLSNKKNIALEELTDYPETATKLRDYYNNIIYEHSN